MLRLQLFIQFCTLLFCLSRLAFMLQRYDKFSNLPNFSFSFSFHVPAACVCVSNVIERFLLFIPTAGLAVGVEKRYALVAMVPTY